MNHNIAVYVDKVINYLREQKYSRNRLWRYREIARAYPDSMRGIIAKFKYNSIVNAANAYIPLDTEIAERPTFPHWIYGVFISQGAQIGSGCTIFQQVTIGSNSLRDSQGVGYPTLGDNVYIGAGAKIIGGVRIGNNVRIGANCVVTKDIPDNATVVMQKPRIIIHEIARENSFVEVDKKQRESELSRS